LIEIINKQLLLQLVGYLCYWQMGFNSVFKGLRHEYKLKILCFSVHRIIRDSCSQLFTCTCMYVT